MIEFKNVFKKYANFKALDEINLIIPSSSIFGIVGKAEQVNPLYLGQLIN